MRDKQEMVMGNTKPSKWFLPKQRLKKPFEKCWNRLKTVVLPAIQANEEEWAKRQKNKTAKSEPVVPIGTQS